MSIAISTIVERVRKAIDEVSQAGTGLVNVTADETNLTDIITDKIPYALQRVIEMAPAEKLGSDIVEKYSPSEQQTKVTRTNDGVVKVELPDDLLRIIEARLSSWSYSPDPVPSTSQVYLMQQDTYARGSYDRPVNIITNRTDGKKVLEMYCQKENTDELVFLFVKKPVFNNNTTSVNVPALLEASFIYQVAALTMVAFREDIADTLFNISKGYMNGDAPLTSNQ